MMLRLLALRYFKLCKHTDRTLLLFLDYFQFTKSTQNLLGRGSVAVRTESELISLLIRIAHGTRLASIQSEFMILTVQSTSTFPPSGPTRQLWTTAL